MPGARNSDGWVWSSENGRRVQAHTIIDAFKRDARCVGLDGTPHLARHWHASMLLCDSEPVPDVSARLGRANPFITMMTYAHVLRSKRGAQTVLGQVFRVEAEPEAAE